MNATASILTEMKHADNAAPSLVLPLAQYVSAEDFALDRDLIFSRVWRMVGHASEIPNPGDYFVREFDVPRASIIIVRGRDGVVRAFHNVCRHRGNVLTRDSAGCKARFTCSFHGWTWSNTGNLLAITDEGQFPGVDKADLGLIAVHCELWNDTIFINFASEPEETLHEWMDDLADGWEDYFDGQEKLSSHRFEIEANWNLGVNAFTEGYHTMFIHQNTAGDYQGGKSNPQRHRPFMQFMKRHTRYSAPANPDHKLPPCEQIAYRVGRKMLPAACFDNDPLPPAVNPSRAEHWLFDVVEIFPNVVCLFGQNYRMEFTFEPVSASRTKIIHETFAYKPENLAQRAAQELFRGREREVVREDLSLLEVQQAALDTKAIDNVYLSRQEMALAHHFKVRNAMLGRPL